MNHMLPKRRGLAALFILLSACSDFWGEGPNPREAGRYLGVVPTAGNSGVSGNTNNGGSGQMCLADQAFSALLAENGANCEPVKGCLLEHCSAELEACLGLEFRSSDFDGGKCSDYAGCLESCQCNPNCSNGCRPLSAPCGTCLGTLLACEQTSCIPQLEVCDPLVVGGDRKSKEQATDGQGHQQFEQGEPGGLAGPMEPL